VADGIIGIIVVVGGVTYFVRRRMRRQG
jgi:hypothetical protein